MDDKIVLLAEYTLRQWKSVIDASKGDCWHKQGERQVYQDTMQAMKYYGLIADYNVATCKVTLADRVDSSKKRFIKTGKTIRE